MAPESERANCLARKLNPIRFCKLSHGHEGDHNFGQGQSGNLLMASGEPNEPTLTCSEVVERLAKECVDCGFGGIGFDHEKATAILHSWRERRVQELEEALMKTDSYLSLLRHRASIPWGTTGFPQQGEVDQVIGTSRKLLANSEWREQIRKGAKHE